MELVVNIPAELETELSAEAARVGLPLSEYALRLIVAGRVARTTVTNGNELMRYWRAEGVIGTRREIADSQSHARSLREQAEHRSRS
jgi:hypothetical protein